MFTDNVKCNCGEWSGVACSWSGYKKETVIVEYMPEQYKQSHISANNSGIYPLNGASRIQVEQSCANIMILHDSDWISICQKNY